MNVVCLKQEGDEFMDHVTAEEKQQLIEAFNSIIRKSEKALSHMKENSSQTKQLEKRMKAVRIGLKTLTSRWDGLEWDVCLTDALEAKKELESLLHTLPSFLKKLKEGSGQRTYMERRIKALNLAIFYINDLTEKLD